MSKEEIINTFCETDNNIFPDKLKCVKCRSVLKDACVVPCGCRFCLTCINDTRASGCQFCIGPFTECRKSLLSYFAPDYRANISIAKWTVDCSRKRCLQESQLANIENGVEESSCKRSKLSCKQDKLTAEQIIGSIKQENLNHSEIMIEMVTNINNEVESYKREIETLKKSDENSKIDGEMLKREVEMLKREVEILKCEVEVKDGHIRSLVDKMLNVRQENKLIREEKEDLTIQMRILLEKIDRGIDKKGKIESGKIDQQITVITDMITSNTDKLGTEVKSVTDEILCQVDASCEWTINGDVRNTYWILSGRNSQYFCGTVYPYIYRLTSWNDGTFDGALTIWLRIYHGRKDEQLPWPFTGTVAITVGDTSKREACRSVTLQCVIARPTNNLYGFSDSFIFQYCSLVDAGLDLSHGVRVSCMIVPGVDG